MSAYVGVLYMHLLLFLTQTLAISRNFLKSIPCFISPD